jgi:hypothetical protein
MDQIRPLAARDLQSVADLFVRVFRRSAPPAPASLTESFRRLYLEYPARRDDIPSLVLESGGRPAGFLGALPLPFSHRGKALTAVVAGNYMVDPGVQDPFAGVRLLKALLAGPQEVTFTDTANGPARRIWEGLGGKTLPVQSQQWLRVLRPAEFGASLAGRKDSLKRIEPAMRVVARMLDGLAGMLPLPGRIADAWPSSPLEADELLRLIENLNARRALVPAYTRETLAWRLAMAAEKLEFGPLRMRAVTTPDGRTVGWFLAYPNRGGMGQVLQWSAEPHDARGVFRSMIADAEEQGSLALVGRAEPGTMREVSGGLGVFLQRDSFVEVYARDAEVLTSLLLGDAFFTRLEGEWWTRMQGDRFA